MLGEKAAVNPTRRGDILCWMWVAASLPQGPSPRAGARTLAEAFHHFARKRRLGQKPGASELESAGSPRFAAHQPRWLAVIGKAVGLDDAAALAPADSDLDRVHEG